VYTVDFWCKPISRSHMRLLRCGWDLEGQGGETSVHSPAASSDAYWMKSMMTLFSVPMDLLRERWTCSDKVSRTFFPVDQNGIHTWRSPRSLRTTKHLELCSIRAGIPEIPSMTVQQRTTTSLARRCDTQLLLVEEILTKILFDKLNAIAKTNSDKLPVYC